MQARTTRREWLGACAGGAAVWALGARAAFARTAGAFDDGGPEGRVLVVIELVGGNDGLNTVAPIGQEAYFRSRPTLALAPDAVHRLDEAHGLHPALGGLALAFREGDLAVVQSVGYPRPDRSHFRSREIWHTADPDHPARGRGWLGPLAEALVAGDGGAAAAVHVGAGDLPLALRGGRRLPPSIEGPESLRLHPAGRAIAAWRDRLVSTSADGDLGFLREAARSSYALASLAERGLEGDSAAAYPPTPIGRSLALAARMIAAGFPARVYYARHEGFDTHSRQAPVHAARLAEFDSAASAFRDDLRRAGLARRVVTFVFSEFGRRVAENGSRGTDHGAGAPVFLLGGSVRGGLHGTPPDLERLLEGDVPPRIDFRRVYASLAEWLGAPRPSEHEPLSLFA